MAEMVDVYDGNRVFTGKTIEREGAFLHENEYTLYVLAIVEDAQGRFLITQRALDKHWAAGSWEVTGGGVAAGESTGQAVVRECSEEVGLDVSAQPLEPVFSYANVDLERGDNYIVDIYHFHLDFEVQDVVLQESEAIGCKLATWDEIAQLEQQGAFLHYRRIEQALRADGTL